MMTNWRTLVRRRNAGRWRVGVRRTWTQKRLFYTFHYSRHVFLRAKTCQPFIDFFNGPDKAIRVSECPINNLWTKRPLTYMFGMLVFISFSKLCPLQTFCLKTSMSLQVVVLKNQPTNRSFNFQLFWNWIPFLLIWLKMQLAQTHNCSFNTATLL